MNKMRYVNTEVKPSCHIADITDTDHVGILMKDGSRRVIGKEWIPPEFNRKPYYVLIHCTDNSVQKVGMDMATQKNKRNLLRAFVEGCESIKHVIVFDNVKDLNSWAYGSDSVEGDVRYL